MSFPVTTIRRTNPNKFVDIPVPGGKKLLSYRQCFLHPDETRTFFETVTDFASASLQEATAMRNGKPRYLGYLTGRFGSDGLEVSTTSAGKRRAMKDRRPIKAWRDSRLGKELEALVKRVNEEFSTTFNSAQVQLLSPQHELSATFDDSTPLSPGSRIACLRFGATRRTVIRAKGRGKMPKGAPRYAKTEFYPTSGSISMMQPRMPGLCVTTVPVRKTVVGQCVVVTLSEMLPVNKWPQ